jgi:ABC-2 type transport system permease protein
VNTTYLRLEIRRALRNRRFIVVSLLMPAMLLLIFGSTADGATENGVGVAAYVMVSMAIFGAMSAAIATGGTIAVERGIGWNRQLRLTPLRPGRYVLSKAAVALLLALPPLVLTYLVGAFAVGVDLPAQTWLLIGVGSWLGAPCATISPPRSARPVRGPGPRRCASPTRTAGSSPSSR